MVNTLTLLDNENVLHTVHCYLAAQDLGTITPHQLCHQINEVVIPALGLTGPNSSISEQTAINWLHKLGYLCKDIKKGIYHDGHECPDVVVYRKTFLEQMQKYERCVTHHLSVTHSFDICHYGQAHVQI